MSKLDIKLDEEDLFSEDIKQTNTKVSNKSSDFDDFNDNFDDLNDFNDDRGGFSADGQIAMEKHSDLLKELTSFAPYLKATVNNWLGVTWDDLKKKYVVNKNIEPIMNIKGVTWCIGRLGTYTRKNNIITNISSADYKAIIMDLIKELWLNVMTRKKEFGLTNNGDVLRVCNELQHAAELVLMGAGNGKYTTFLGSNTSYSIQGKVDNGEQQTASKPKSSKMKRLFGL